MSRQTRDGTPEPISRDQILRPARGQGNIHFPCSAEHEQDWQPYPVDSYSAICDDHTYIHTYIPYDFLSRFKFSTRKPRQTIVEFLLTYFLVGSGYSFTHSSSIRFLALLIQSPPSRQCVGGGRKRPGSRVPPQGAAEPPLLRTVLKGSALILTLSAAEVRIKEVVLSRIELTTPH